MKQKLLKSSLCMFALSAVATMNAYATPAPTFNTSKWSDYVTKTHEVPGLFGYDNSYLNAQKFPLADNDIPLILRCQYDDGCNQYSISGGNGDVDMIIQNGSANNYIAFGFNESPAYSGTYAIDAVFIPSDRAGHNSFYQKLDPLNPQLRFAYGGDPNDGHKNLLNTQKGDIVAVVYVNQDRLKDPNLNMFTQQSSNNAPPSQYVFQKKPGNNSFLSDNAYSQNGVVWQLIGDTRLSSGSIWNQAEQTTSGTTQTSTLSMALSVGAKVSADAFGFLQAEVDTNFTTTWGSSFEVQNSTTNTTTAECRNNDLNKDMVCGLYQAYGATRITAPGLADDTYNAFAAFNSSSIGSPLILQVGQASDQITDDTNVAVGAMYPLSGTLFPSSDLVTQIPTVLVPRNSMLSDPHSPI